MRAFKAVVAGAGLAGATAARLLAEKGIRTLVVEKLRHVAGHCHDHRNEAGITIHTHGPHIFHTTDKAVWEFVQRFSNFRNYQHRVLSYAEGQYFPFPINADTINQAFGLTLPVHEAAAFLAEQAAKAAVPQPPRNFRDAIVAQVGERLYSLFFEHYTRKQWGRDPSLLSPDLASRIPIRANRDDRYFADPYQGIPEHGYTAMVEAMLDHPLISVVLGADWFELKEDLDPDLTVYTGPLDRMFDFRHGRLEYRSLDLVFRTLDMERYQPAAVVNYPNDYDWTRITEFKYFLDEKSPRTTICIEYPKPEGEPYYIVPDQKNTERRARYMEEVARLEATGRWLFIGRLAEYRYYNMDQVISAAMKKLAACY